MAWFKSTFSSNGDCVEVFRKSTFSGPDGSCVEVQRMATDQVGGAYVRDSKSHNGPVLQFNESEWQAFIKGVKDGQFD